MGQISAETHKFRRGKVPGDGTCLYWSFLVVFEEYLIDVLGEDIFNMLLTEILNKDLFKRDLMEILNEGLRKEVADYIRKHEDMHDIVKNSTNKGYSVSKYCSLIEQGKLWSGDPELKVLSNLYNKLICVISVTKCNGEKRVWSRFYGENNQSATECVCILYDAEEGHYDPLYVINMQNPGEKQTRFERNDNALKVLLENFIRDEINFYGNVNLDAIDHVNVNELLLLMNVSNEPEKTSNSSTKRKVLEVNNIPMSSNNDKQPPISISDEYYNPNKRVKGAEDGSDRMSAFYENNTDATIMKKILSTDCFTDEYVSSINQQPLTDLPTVSNDEHQEERTSLKTESVEELNGGTQDDNKFKYNDESSEAKSSS